MTRRNPFHEIEEWIDRMSEQVESTDLGAFGSGQITLDVIDTGDAYEIHADLPGYDRDDIDLTLTDRSLRIEANREEEHTTESERYIRRERRRQQVSRSVRLPESVLEDDATANYRNGVLTVELPKEHGDGDGQQIDIE